MKNRIAAAFQNTVDFELQWDLDILEALIRHYGIRRSEIQIKCPIHSERELIITLLAHMSAGDGSECLADSSVITRSFASRFSYQVTLGGTGIRAAMAIEKIGYRSTVHACSLNHYFRCLLPKAVKWISSVPDEGEDFHPHVIVQYPAAAHIRVNDIDFVTQKPNRVIFAYDPPSMNLEISSAFAEEVTCANVLLIASYNIIKDKQILNKRLQQTLDIIKSLPKEHTVIMEDGCFESAQMRRLVLHVLSPHLDIFSMNEDELQDRFGRRINVLDPSEVIKAIQTIYGQIHVPTLICHSAHWALAYGKLSPAVQKALESGICMASTRFRLGDDYGKSDYEQTRKLPDSRKGIEFCKALSAKVSDKSLFALPGKELSFIAKPFTIGLGDAFAGGMLPQLLPEAELENAYI